MAGALAEHADGVLAGMTAAEVALARRILLMLVTADNTRRLLKGRDLLQVIGSEGWKVMDMLTDARLVLARKGEREEAEYELVHESLISQWNRYPQWIEESREERQALEQLTLRLELWAKKGKRLEDTLQGQSLRDARAVARRTEKLGPVVQEFLAASETQAEAVHQRELERERKRVRTARIFIAVIGVVLG